MEGSKARRVVISSLPLNMFYGPNTQGNPGTCIPAPLNPMTPHSIIATLSISFISLTKRIYWDGALCLMDLINFTVSHIGPFRKTGLYFHASL